MMWEIPHTHCLRAVSYTHLDVYKRQDDRRAELEEILSQTTPGTFERKRYEYSVEYCDKAVSYTHLEI